MASAPAAADTQLAYLDVHVPSDAIVYLQNQRMSMAGAHRRFVTPPLADGQPHVYTVTVQAQRNGQLVSKTAQVSVRAGEQAQVVVNLDAPSPATPVAAAAPVAVR